MESGFRRSVKVRSAEFEDPRRTWMRQYSMLTGSPLPTAAVRCVSRQDSRTNQCTGAAATAQMRPSCRTANGVPAGVNRTSTATSRAVSFAVAVTVYALSQVPGHHFFPAGDRRTPHPGPVGHRTVFPRHFDGLGRLGVHLAVHQTIGDLTAAGMTLRAIADELGPRPQSAGNSPATAWKAGRRPMGAGAGKRLR